MAQNPTRPLPALVGSVLVALLAACGGGSVDADASADTKAHSDVVSPAAAPAVAPLLDAAGLPLPALRDAIPADPGARTRHGRYATPAQAARLEETLGVRAIAVDVQPGPDAATAVELATLIVFGVQAAHDLSPDSPVLVRGPDLRLAATTVHQLEASGFTRVFLVNH